MPSLYLEQLQSVEPHSLISTAYVSTPILKNLPRKHVGGAKLFGGRLTVHHTTSFPGREDPQRTTTQRCLNTT